MSLRTRLLFAIPVLGLAACPAEPLSPDEPPPEVHPDGCGRPPIRGDGGAGASLVPLGPRRPSSLTVR